jgi:hypothetical protein
LILGGNRQSCERPSQHGEHGKELDGTRNPCLASRAENSWVQPGEQERLNEHRREAKRDDHIGTIQLQLVVAILEKDEVPDIAQWKRGQNVGCDGQPEKTLMRTSALALDSGLSSLDPPRPWSVVDARDSAKVVDQVRLLAGTWSRERRVESPEPENAEEILFSGSRLLSLDSLDADVTRRGGGPPAAQSVCFQCQSEPCCWGRAFRRVGRPGLRATPWTTFAAGVSSSPAGLTRASDPWTMPDEAAGVRFRADL